MLIFFASFSFCNIYPKGYQRSSCFNCFFFYIKDPTNQISSCFTVWDVGPAGPYPPPPPIAHTRSTAFFEGLKTSQDLQTHVAGACTTLYQLRCVPPNEAHEHPQLTRRNMMKWWFKVGSDCVMFSVKTPLQK